MRFRGLRKRSWSAAERFSAAPPRRRPAALQRLRRGRVRAPARRSCAAPDDGAQSARRGVKHNLLNLLTHRNWDASFTLDEERFHRVCAIAGDSCHYPWRTLLPAAAPARPSENEHSCAIATSVPARRRRPGSMTRRPVCHARDLRSPRPPTGSRWEARAHLFDVRAAARTEAVASTSPVVRSGFPLRVVTK